MDNATGNHSQLTSLCSNFYYLRIHQQSHHHWLTSRSTTMFLLVRQQSFSFLSMDCRPVSSVPSSTDSFSTFLLLSIAFGSSHKASDMVAPPNGLPLWTHRSFWLVGEIVVGFLASFNDSLSNTVSLRDFMISPGISLKFCTG